MVQPKPIGRRLSRLCKGFDPVIDATVEHQVVIASLARRAIDLRDGIHREAPSSTTTASVLVRALADLLILVLWVEQCPRFHARLWRRDSELRRIEVADALRAGLALNGIATPEVYSTSHRLVAKRDFDRMRRFAVKKGVRPARGSLLPTVRDRTLHAPSVEREIYDQAWRRSARRPTAPHCRS